MPKRAPNRRSQTITEARFPLPEKFVKLSEKWTVDAAANLLQFVWQAYGLLKSEILNEIDLEQADEELERSLTQQLEPRIHRLMSGDEPYYVQHAPREYETRQAPPAQSPEYDIAFVFHANPRVMWPLEAKVLRTDTATAEYIHEIKLSYLTCRYAPFSAEAGMIGYLVNGLPVQALKNIANNFPCRLKKVPGFDHQSHRLSTHRRRVPKGKKYPARFACHHLIMALQ